MRKIEDYFRSFAPANIQGARTLARVVDNKISEDTEEEFFKQIIDLLFPATPGEFKTTAQIFSTLKDLGSPSRVNDRFGFAPKEIAKLFRLYTTSLKPGDTTLESQISEFYTKSAQGKRPSAYTAIGPDGKPKEPSSTPLTELVKASVGETAINPRLTFLLVDTPSIDMKFRSADKAEAFLNYVPSFIASQLVPHVEVDFTFNRSLAPDAKDSRPLTTMSPLKFLLGAEGIDPSRQADTTMYDAVERKTAAPPVADAALKLRIDKLRAAKFALERDQAASQSFPVRDAKGNVIKTTEGSRILQLEKAISEAQKQLAAVAVQSKTAVVRSGMELFTMPQTLINMDYDQELNPRYNPVINPTAPFGVITGLTVDVRTNVGMSGGFKTANLTLKLFDRSRLAEIADFISPKLFKAATIWLTYGWRAPVVPPDLSGLSANVKTYYDFINESMMKREAYGVQNSSINIEKDGTVTVSIALFTRGATELLTSKDGLSNEFEQRLQAYDSLLAQMRTLARRMGLQSVNDLAKDVRGATIISSALAGNTATIDSKALDSEINGFKKIIQSGNFGDDGKKFISLVTSFYTQTSGGTTNARDVALQLESRSIAGERLAQLSTPSEDVFAIPLGGQSKEKYKNDYDGDGIEANVLSRLTNWTEKNKTQTQASNADVASRAAGKLGSISFGRIFAHYFGQVARGLIASSAVEEIQVIFYSLNSKAGVVAGLNIAQFPIELATFEEAYSKKIAEQKGENMSFNMLVEVMRESQFSSIHHAAYGFKDLYMQKNGKIEVKDQQSSDQLARRVAENWGNGGAFKLPVIEMYVESGYTSVPEGYRSADLLDQYELAASTTTDGMLNSTRKIMRIHVYDKAAIPSPEVSRILSTPGGYETVSITKLRGALKSKSKTVEAWNAIASALNDGMTVDEISTKLSVDLEISPDTVKDFFTQVSFKTPSGAASFEKVKQKVAELVPTITMGTNGSMLESATYTTQQDALLSAIFMRRNKGEASDGILPNGSGGGDLPMRVIPGALSVTSMGCPVLEYMQQFFVDMGTRTTVDNLYNITGLTHTLTPGKFMTQVKFTFAEAYGQYEEAPSVSAGVAAEIRLFAKELADAAKAQEKNKAAPKNPPKEAKANTDTAAK